jgi:hypothetical protein
MEFVRKVSKGFIIFGNSRSGKSTISSGIAKSPLRVVHDKNQATTFIEPIGIDF